MVPSVRIVITIVFLAITFLSCNGKKTTMPQTRLLFDTLTIDSMWNYELSRDLKALAEESLFNDTSKTGEVWRSTITGSFNQPYCIRVQVLGTHDDSIKIIQATYKEGRRISVDTTIPKYVLQTTESVGFDSSINARWNKFQSLVEEYDFWNQPTQHGECETDGVHAVFEARVNGKYHAIMSCGDVRENRKLEILIMTFMASLIEADALLDKARWINESRYSIAGDTLY